MSKVPKEIAVHPVVLLSVVDHYYRLVKETSRRVIGVLLGEYVGDKVDITNCYALPFEEDPKDKKVWFVDHIYNEQMFEMHQKINYKEVIVGWYSSGPKIRPHDIEINEVFRKYTPNPIFVIIDVQEKTEALGLPTESYIMREEVDPDGQLMKTFVKIPSVIEASLPEQIGVEFLLRDINDSNKSPLHRLVNQKLTSVKALSQRLTEIKTYLQNVIMKRVSPNPQIINNIQEIFNYLPNFETEDIIKSLSIQTNNDYLLLYLSWMIRSIISLHKLLNNKIMIKEEEKRPAEKSAEKKKEEAKEETEKKEAEAKK